MFCTVETKRKPLNSLKFRGFHLFAVILRGATSNRKSVCITLFFNKLYLFYDVNPLNKVFTALHRLTQVCILGTIPKGKYNKLFCYSIYDLGNSFSLTSFM